LGIIIIIKDFKGKVGVITGAANGIGRSLALEFAKRDMNLVITDINKDALHKVKDELIELDAEVLPIVADVTDRNQIEQLADKSYKKFGKVNILCNNAGVLSGGPTHLLSLKDWDWVLEVNVFGVVYCVKSFLKRMLDSGEPCHIVNTASVAGLLADPKSVPYGVSKHAVVVFSEILLQQYFNTNVNFSVLCPSYVKTELYRNSIKLGQTHSNLFNPTEEMLDASEIFKNGFLEPIDTAISPDYIAEKVIEAISKNIFYIITHPELMPEIQGRFERMKEDAYLLNKNAVVTDEELFKDEDLVVYNHEFPQFSLKYPKRFTSYDLLQDSILKFAVYFGSYSLSIYVSESQPYLRLKDAEKILITYLKTLGTDVKILKNKEIKLKNGIIPALESEIEYKRSGFLQMKSICLSIVIEEKLVIVRATSLAHKFNNNLKKIISSFEL
jgi:short-subunit dehydrogenase